MKHVVSKPVAYMLVYSVLRPTQPLTHWQTFHGQSSWWCCALNIPCAFSTTVLQCTISSTIQSISSEVLIQDTVMVAHAESILLQHMPNTAISLYQDNGLKCVLQKGAHSSDMRTYNQSALGCYYCQTNSLCPSQQFSLQYASGCNRFPIFWPMGLPSCPMFLDNKNTKLPFAYNWM